jgi:glycosyltransferase involved in cell wall biosynthesis
VKILIVSQYFWPEHFVVNSLSLELKAKGHEVVILTGLPNYPHGSFFPGYSFWKGPWREEYHGIKVIRVPLVPRGKGSIKLALNYLSFVIFGILPGSLKVENDFDVIFCMGLSPVTSCIPAVFLRFWLRKPLIFWVQDLWPESVAAVGAAKSKFILDLIGTIVRFIYLRCDLILVQSQAFSESVIRWGGAAEKIQYIPNWAKVPSPLTMIPAWLTELPPGFRVIFAGNIGKAQDMPTVLQAAEILKDCTEIQWLIVGDGSEKSFVDQQILQRKLQHTVHTFGRRPNEDMPALLSLGDIMLVSLTDEPIFSLTVPSKIQGYMASSKPILAAVNGEGARIVEEARAGLTCPSESPKALAEAVLQFYRMPIEERQKIGNNGFEYFKIHFEESIVIKEIEKACQILSVQVKRKQS